jgi:SAM-dependent methyltransferase
MSAKDAKNKPPDSESANTKGSMMSSISEEIELPAMLQRQAFEEKRTNADKTFDAQRDIGIKDATLSGWFLRESREVYRGFQLKSDDIVVDVGCGNGSITRLAKECGAARVIGIDLDRQEALLCRKHLDCAGNGCEVIVADAIALPLGASFASKVICREVLEHVDNPMAIMSEIVRIGLPGAEYLLSIPDAVSESVDCVARMPLQGRRPRHVHSFETPEFIQLVEGAGLTIRSLDKDGFYQAVRGTLRQVSCEKKGGRDVGLLQDWDRVWGRVLNFPRGQKVKQALDQIFPKSQIIVAQKPQ